MPSSKTSTTKYDTGPWKALTGPIQNEAMPALRAGYDYSTTGAGGQLLNQATGAASDTIGGRYLDLANNPYLQNAMNAASRSSQTYYDTLGARTGRGLRGADFAGAMAQGTEAARLQPLLQLYESERGRQQQMIGAAPSLNMAGMAPSLALGEAYRGLGALGKSGTESTKTTEFNPAGIAATVLGALTNPMGTAAGMAGNAAMGALGGGSSFSPGTAANGGWSTTVTPASPWTNWASNLAWGTR